MRLNQNELLSLVAKWVRERNDQDAVDTEAPIDGFLASGRERAQRANKEQAAYRATMNVAHTTAEERDNRSLR